MGSKKRAAADSNEHRAKRTNSPEVPVIAGRIYDSQNGKTCHQCRHKIMHFAASCMNKKREKPCTIKLCHKCLLNRYGEKVEEVMLREDWTCPKCRGLCNCSVCMKKKGLKPTGLLVLTAKATGFSSVSEMLLVNGSECLDHDNNTTCKVASPNTQASDNKMSESEDSSRKDPAWKYARLEKPGDVNTFICGFCGKITKGGVYRMKQHLVGSFRNAAACRKCPEHVKEEIRVFMTNKKEIKQQRNLVSDDVETELYGIHDEWDEEDVSTSGKRIASNSSSSAQPSCKKQKAKGPMDAFFPPKQIGASATSKKQTTLNAAYKKEMRANVIQSIARWFYDSGIPLNACNYESFGPMIEAIGQFGPGLKPPTYHELRVSCLKKEIENTEEMMKAHKEQWAKVGCTIMTDGWTDRRNRTLLNFLVNSPKGTVFIESIDASNVVKDGNKMFQLIDDFVERIGEDNVVQVVTNSASASVMAGRLLEAKRPTIFWSPCAAHCLDLMLEDIFKISRLRKTLKRAMKISNFIYARPGLLNMMRTFTSSKELIRPAKTRFATASITLSSIYTQKANLRKMFTSDEWKNSKWSKEQQGKRVLQTIMMAGFWNTIVFALKVSCPLVRVLRLVDGEKKPPMGYIYEAMDRAKEAIAKAFNFKEEKYNEIYTIIDRRWNLQLHRPLHAAGYYLNPEFFYKDPSIQDNTEITDGLYACITRMITSLEQQDKVLGELSKYKEAEESFGSPLAIRNRDKRSPVEWWDAFGNSTPSLKKFARKILGLTCSASGCERNWSVFEQEFVISPRKKGKESSLNGNNESNLNLQNQTPNSNKKKLMEMKREELKEICDGNKVDVKCSKKSTPTKSSLEETSQKQTEANGMDESLPSKKKGSKKGTSKHTASDVSKKISLCHEDAKASDVVKEEDKRSSKADCSKEEKDLDIHKYAKTSEDAKNRETKVKDKQLPKSQENMKCSMNIQNKEFGACVSLPPGSRLTTVADIKLTSEDVGHALQFLEFCAAFGKALNLKKGHAESVLKDLMRERTLRRRGRVHDSLTVRFLIQLLSLILKDMDEESEISSPTNDRSSWLPALKKCVSVSPFKLNDLKPDYFDGGDSCYDDLDFSKKLRLLTYLCDEALNTTKLRNWIEDQHTNFVEEQKEIKEQLAALKDKEKQAKSKLQDELAKALIAKNGLPLSIAERDVVVLQIKRNVAEAQAERLVTLELASKKRQRSDATRTVPIVLDVNGRVFWKLRGFAGEGNILLQDMESWESVNLSEKWSVYKGEQKQEIEKYIYSLRLKTQWK